MLDFNTGDDIPQIDLENIEEAIDYILSERVSSEEVIQLEDPTSPAVIQPEISPTPIVASPLEKKRGRRGTYKRKREKSLWACTFCKSVFSYKQSLKEHMNNVRVCQKKQKRLEERSIVSAPHECLGATLQSCIETLQDHKRLNDLQAKIRLSLIIIYI